MDLKQIIKDTVGIEEVVSRLGLDFERHGNFLLGPCLTGHESRERRCFRISTSGDFFRCFCCGVAGDIVSLVGLVKQCDFRDSLKWLIEHFRPDLSFELERSELEESPEVEEYYQRASLYELVFEYGKKLLYEPIGKESLDYLITQRRYQTENLKQTEWMYFPTEKDIRELLFSQHPEGTSAVNEQIGTLALGGLFGDNFRLAIPYRDRRGAITGLSKRATLPDGIKVKTGDGKIHENVRWDKTPGFEQTDFFNLNNCKGYDTLLIVEGLPDALIFPALGVKNVVAMGNVLLTASHIEALRSFGVRKVIISFDYEPPKEDHTISGIENTEIAIGLLNNSGITSFVIDPPLLSPHKDPDEFVREKGVDAFLALMENSQRGSTWKAERILGSHDITTDVGREKTLDEALLFWWTLRDHMESSQFKETVRTALGYRQAVFDQFIQEYRNKKVKERSVRGYQDFFRKGQRLLKDGNLAGLRELFDQKAKDLRVKRVNRVIEPPSFEEYRERVKNRPGGLKTGYALLDDVIRIPLAATTMLTGRPSHGKTTFLLNLFLNMIRTYKDHAFFFFCFEHSADHIVSKVITMLSGHVFHERKNIEELERYLREGRGDIREVEEGIVQFKAYTEKKKRLWIMDDPHFVDELEDSLTYLSGRHDIGAVFIDCIQDMKVKGVHEKRQRRIEIISAKIQEIGLGLQVPILLGVRAEIERGDKEYITLEHLRETADIERDAHIVLGLFNPSTEKARDEGIEVTTQEIDLRVTILKNRDGPVNEARTLKLHRPTHTIREPGN
jgi:DNA primase catalytic core